MENKRALVLGLGISGIAAARLLRNRGAKVTIVDQGQEPTVHPATDDLRRAGITVRWGINHLPPEPIDLAVTSPGISLDNPLITELKRRRVPLIGELELGFRHSSCLNIAISGTNGKTTTTELISKVLSHCHRKTIAAGNIGVPLCAVVDQTRELDFLTLEVSSFQLETIEYFRPSVAVLLNVTPDHLDRYPTMREYILAKARLFLNQQDFDWAIIQKDALAQLRAHQISIPAKVITFSACDSTADLYLDRGLLISRLPDWPGPLLNMEQCLLRGPHNAENLMATLAVGRTLRLPLDQVNEALRTFKSAPDRCELVAEINGVQFVNDSKATNPDALLQAVRAMRRASGTQPNIWLLAGGKDKGFSFHEVGPALSERVKGAFLFGETREKIRAAWSLFTPCTVVDSLLEAFAEAARHAASGDVVLLSPACSSFDQFRNYQHRGEVFRNAVRQRLQGTGSGRVKEHHHTHDGGKQPALIELQT